MSTYSLCKCPWMCECHGSRRTLMIVIFVFGHYFTVFKLIYSNDLWFYLQKQIRIIFSHTQRTPTVLRATCTAKITNIGGPYRLRFPWTTNASMRYYLYSSHVCCSDFYRGYLTILLPKWKNFVRVTDILYDHLDIIWL